MKKTTRRALFLSFAAMFLCFTMLLGTTYAWFTDSVESGVNQIVAGNLDVELWNDNVQITGANNDPELFAKVTKWEPGAMAWENLTVKNVGDLAFKYQLSFDTTAVGSKDLREVVKVAIVEGGIDTNTDTRDTLKSLNFVKFDELDVVTGAITKEDASQEKTYGVVLYWAPSDIDNEYNMNNGKSGTPLSIDVYVNLYATQLDAEEDSFGKDYDEDAWHESFKVNSADALQDAISNAVAGDVIELTKDIEVDGDLVLDPAVDTYALNDNYDIILDLNGNVLTVDYVTTTCNAAITNGTLVMDKDYFVYAMDEATITLDNVKIKSDDISVYAAEDGTVILKDVTFVTTATSNPVQNYGGTMILDNVTVAQEGDANSAWYSSAVQTINLLVKNEETGKYSITAQADTTINSGKYVGKKALMISAPGGDVTINGGEFIGEYALQADFAPQYYVDGDKYTSNITINGGNFTGAIKATAAVKLVIKGGTFSADPSAYVAEGYKAIETENGWEVVSANYYVATTLTEVMKYAKISGAIIDAKGANLGDFYYDGTFAEGVVLKNAKFTYVYGASVNGVATFENCEFVSDHSYSANFSDGSYTGKVIFNNCYFDGWSSFGDAITYVEMNNCTFDWNNPYSMLRFYQNAELNGCNFVNIEGIDTNKTGTVVTFNNCTGIEGKIYNNGSAVGTWIVDGNDISDTVTAW